MLNTNFKIAWRSLWKHKAYSLINIIGLTAGLTACLIVATVVFDELSYDKQWTKGDNIYRILSVNANVKDEGVMPVAFSGIAPNLKKDLPEVIDYCRVSVGESRLKFNENAEGVSFNILHAEPSVWNLFDFKVLQGTPRSYVKGYTNLVISKSMQQQYFKGNNMIGKVISTVPDYGKPKKYLITGVIEDMPQNTHLRAQAMAIAEHKPESNAMPVEDTFYYFETQYVLLKPGVNINSFTDKVNNWYKSKLKNKKVDYLLKFQPLKDVYLKSDFASVQTVHGSMRNVYIFAGVAVLLLLIACINFVNLTISRVFTRAKETGVRKVLGAAKGQLIIRFLAESVLFFVIALALAMVLYPLTLQPVQTYIGHTLVVNFYDSVFLLSTVSVVLLVSIGTGLYPAWYLSRPQPTVILRDKLSGDVGLNTLKKVLLIGQFAISVIIIVVTLVVHSQITFMSSKNLGFDKENLVNLDFTDWGTSGEAFKNEVKRLPGVSNASISDWYPSSGSGSMSRMVDVGGEKLNVFFIQGDADLPAVLKLHLQSGRLFDPQSATDAIDQDSLMNQGRSPETKALIQQQPLIATTYTAGLLGLKLNSKTPKFEGIPVGIVSNFYSESLHNKLKPTLIQAISTPKYGAMLIRVSPGKNRAFLTALSKLYKSYYPTKPFKYNWVSDLVNEQYKTELKLQQLFTCFSILTLFLACLGLFGMVTFTVEQRVKEIGIRKVLGADVIDIINLISKSYLILVMLGFIVAAPLAWYAMDKWLQNFAYRINLNWWLFALAGIAAIIISLLTISLQSVKAALANPVKSLRNE
ncbi:FtsX-like permease family protein [Mucilaginibacter litoreus]|uniref:FtsX-like permease family protein n=1 Tax=Mucilaginibacter litoreus TaxID=1048221 RepID=A0ABW3AST9_9SPHI